MNSAERRAIVNTEIRKALTSLTPSMPGRYSGVQVSAAKRIGRKNALAVIDAQEARNAA